MIISLTGTPGTGKTSISKILTKNGFKIVDLNQLAIEKNFILGVDEKRDSKIVDIIKLNNYAKERYNRSVSVILEGHLSHFLKSADKVIVLRKHPNELRKNLVEKGWNEVKIKENLDAEILDVILCEAVDIHTEKKVVEIDTTGKSVEKIAFEIIDLIKKEFKDIKKYKIVNIDWSEEILKEFT